MNYTINLQIYTVREDIFKKKKGKKGGCWHLTWLVYVLEQVLLNHGPAYFSGINSLVNKLSKNKKGRASLYKGIILK